MSSDAEIPVIARRYREAFGAQISPAYDSYLGWTVAGGCKAALGFCRASTAPLFLESYLDEPVENAVSRAFGKEIPRGAIVEIGNFASDNAMAMIGLWGAAANDLAGGGDVAVATLTSALRQMFARIGVPILDLAPARPERLGPGAENWGSYYETDPRVCAGLIAEGQQAITAFLGRRQRRLAA